MLQAEKYRLDQQNEKLRCRIRKLENSVEPEMIKDKIAELEAKCLMERQQVEMVEQELKQTRVQIEKLEADVW